MYPRPETMIACNKKNYHNGVKFYEVKKTKAHKGCEEVPQEKFIDFFHSPEKGETLQKTPDVQKILLSKKAESKRIAESVEDRFSDIINGYKKQIGGYEEKAQVYKDQQEILLQHMKRKNVELSKLSGENEKLTVVSNFVLEQIRKHQKKLDELLYAEEIEKGHKVRGKHLTKELQEKSKEIVSLEAQLDHEKKLSESTKLDSDRLRQINIDLESENLKMAARLSLAEHDVEETKVELDLIGSLVSNIDRERNPNRPGTTNISYCSNKGNQFGGKDRGTHSDGGHFRWDQKEIQMNSTLIDNVESNKLTTKDSALTLLNQLKETRNMQVETCSKNLSEKKDREETAKNSLGKLKKKIQKLTINN